MAGSNYRDIETLKDVIKHVDNMGHSLYFHLVGIDRKIRNILNEYHFVRVYNRLSDDEYFTLLSLCDYNFYLYYLLQRIIHSWKHNFVELRPSYHILVE